MKSLQVFNKFPFEVLLFIYLFIYLFIFCRKTLIVLSEL